MNNLQSKQLINIYFRIYAFILVVVSVCSLFIYSYVFPSSNRIKFYFNQIIFIICFFLSFFLLFKPTLWQFFCYINTLLTTTALINNHIFMGIFLYSTSLLIAFSVGYYRKHFIVKTVVSLSLFFVLLLPLLYFYNLVTFIIALLASLFSFSIISLILLIFSSYLEKLLPDTLISKNITQTSLIDLQQFQFSDKELYCIQSVIAGQPYKVIASDLAVSESVVKKMMCRIFAAFNVDTRERLVAYFAANKVIYPTDNSNYPTVNS